MRSSTRWFFAFFVVSGFCGLVYEVVWLRLAMAQFGVTTPLTSIVLSVFMVGLALGSWGAGRLAGGLRTRSAATLVRLYALAELVVAASAQVVPAVLAAGHAHLAARGQDWGSGAYYVGSGAWITAALLPFCVCMGATFPLAMAALRAEGAPGAIFSFSRLYAGNVAGATAGTLASAFVLVEIFGFRGTLALTASLNAILAALALLLSLQPSLGQLAPGVNPGARAHGGSVAELLRPQAPVAGERSVLAALMLTGLASMALEVVWIRQFTPYVGNMVYSFATILALYLVATAVASFVYRRWSARAQPPVVTAIVWAGIAVAGMLPVLAADPRWGEGGLAAGVARTALGIGAFCAALGFTTPLLVDRWAGGDPERAGGAYACNVIGCIVGPLLAGFVLLPRISEPVATLVLCAAVLLIGVIGTWPGERSRGAVVAAGVAMVAIALGCRTYETRFPGALVRRDAMATVTATGQGMGRQLLVNGIGMTYLTPVTKMMAHLPLAFADHPPQRALIICFGMGTSFRSALSWGVDVTAVELVPSVPALFPYFHADASALVHLPNAHVVVDDGRRFLERTADTFDVVVVDPPPPITTAGSSLIYSREFCRAVRRRLAPGGVFQQWIPGGEPAVVVACARAVGAVFPYVRTFQSVEGWGVHVLASDRPLPALAAADLASRLPAAAREDIVEWGPGRTPEAQFARVLAREVSAAVLVAGAPQTSPLVDDRPINEYYLLRQLRSGPVR